MLLSNFDFNLPEYLIAQQPVNPRSSARLLVYNRSTQQVSHSTVENINNFLPAESVLVANNSKVRQGRLFSHIGSKKVEVLVLDGLNSSTYECILGGHGIKNGTVLNFLTAEGQLVNLSATVQERLEKPGMNTYLLHFSTGLDSVEEAFARFGNTPLPPYIHQQPDQTDRYQTVYAKSLGSAAAPTAGLHFTPELINSLETNNHQWLEVTLQVGIGTFLPLKNEEILQNSLHSEKTIISPATSTALNTAKKERKCITAIGTTSTRTLEAHSENKDPYALIPGSEATSLYIYPGYVFKNVNCLLTNFHLPRSSLLVLVAAFLGNHPTEKKIIMETGQMIERLQALYATAIHQEYRFYSYGDAMLII